MERALSTGVPFTSDDVRDAIRLALQSRTDNWNLMKISTEALDYLKNAYPKFRDTTDLAGADKMAFVSREMIEILSDYMGVQ